MVRLVSICRMVFVSSVLLAVSACGGNSSKELEPLTTSLGVNAYLWEATLDTLSFMPIESANPAAAVILTGWHSLPESPDERVRVMVRFLAQDLRSDGIDVAVTRQRLDRDSWVAVPVQATTKLQIEEAILTHARELRVKRIRG